MRKTTGSGNKERNLDSTNGKETIDYTSQIKLGQAGSNARIFVCEGEKYLYIEGMKLGHITKITTLSENRLHLEISNFYCNYIVPSWLSHHNIDKSELSQLE